MGLKDYLHDIWEAVATTAKGMRITARYGVDPRETITLQYQEERWEPSERFRGFLYNDIKRSTSCTMCVKVCPVDCIALESVRGADKKLVLVSYDINIGRCMYCGLCVEVCPPKSLTHTSGYEKATVTRGELILHFVPEEAEEIKARVAKQVAEAAAKAEAEKAGKEEADKTAKAAGETKPPDASSVPEKTAVPPVAQPAAPAFAAGEPPGGGGGGRRRSPRQRAGGRRNEGTGGSGLLRAGGTDGGVGDSRGDPSEHHLRGGGASVHLLRGGGPVRAPFRRLPGGHAGARVRGGDPRADHVRGLFVEPDLLRQSFQPGPFPAARRGDLPRPVRRAGVHGGIPGVPPEAAGHVPADHRRDRRASDDPLPASVRGRLRAAARRPHRRGAPVAPGPARSPQTRHGGAEVDGPGQDAGHRRGAFLLRPVHDPDAAQRGGRPHGGGAGPERRQHQFRGVFALRVPIDRRADLRRLRHRARGRRGGRRAGDLPAAVRHDGHRGSGHRRPPAGLMR